MMAYMPAKVLPALLPFITLPIYTSPFSPERFGRYVLAYGFSEFLLAATSTGLATGAVRFYTGYRLEGRLGQYFGALFTNIAGVTLVAALLGGIGLTLARQLIPSDLYPLLWAAILAFSAQAWFITLMQALRAQEHSRLYSVFEVSARYLAVAISLGFVLLARTGPIGLILGEALGMTLIALPLALVVLRGTHLDLRRPDREATRRLGPMPGRSPSATSPSGACACLTATCCSSCVAAPTSGSTPLPSTLLPAPSTCSSRCA